MSDLKTILSNNRSFIEAVASGLFQPQHDNKTLLEVINAYQEVDPTIEALYGCATCSTPYKGTFQLILAHLNSTENAIDKRDIGLPAGKTKNTSK